MGAIKLKVVLYGEDENQTKEFFDFFNKEFPELEIVETCRQKKEFHHAINIHHPYFVLISLTGDVKNDIKLIDYFSEIEPYRIFLTPCTETNIDRKSTRLNSSHLG